MYRYFDKALLDEYAHIAESSIDELLCTDDSLVQCQLVEAMRYSAFSGGKRVRPFLTFQFYKACTGNDDVKPAEYYAAAIELIHTYSLIHDDMPAMDDDDLRRGKPTNHVLFGEATAILAGDALQSAAFEAISRNSFCSDTQNIRAVRLLAEKSGSRGMCGGQQIDLQSEGKEINRAILKELHLLKTGCLISCAAMLGCIAANARPELIKAAEEYGNAIGLAFQIKDDILDVEGDELLMGKTLNSDMVSKKATYPVIYGMEQSRLALASLTEKAKQSLDLFPDKRAAAVLADYAEMLKNREN